MDSRDLSYFRVVHVSHSGWFQVNSEDGHLLKIHARDDDLVRQFEGQNCHAIIFFCFMFDFWLPKKVVFPVSVKCIYKRLADMLSY